MMKAVKVTISGMALLAALGGLLIAIFWTTSNTLEIPWLGLGSKFGLDTTGRAFLLFTSILWLLAGVFGLGYLKDDPRRMSYDAFFLVAMLGNFGLILAGDAVTFYSCFALMSFASYGLVIHNRNKAAIKAGRIYMILVIVGEISLFAGLVSMIAGNGLNLTLPVASGIVTSHITMALLVVGFGIKVGVVILHVWLPLAHPAAPPPASAVLSGAMIKAGLLGWIRFLPLGETGFEGWGIFLICAGLASAFYGVVVGLIQTNPKTILAYSSISQMGFMTLGTGAGLLHPELWPALLVAITVYALHHGLAKGALFLGAGSASGGLSTLAWLGILLPALSLSGAPFLSGAVAKYALKSVTSQLSGDLAHILGILLPIAAMGTTFLMIRFTIVLQKYQQTSQTDHCSKWMYWGWGTLVVCSLSLVWIWSPASGAAFSSLKGTNILKAVWPVLIAALLAKVLSHPASWAAKSLVGRVPPGDLLVPIENIIHALPTVVRHWGHLGRGLIPKTGGGYSKLTMVLKIERGLSRWSTATLLLLGFLVIMVGLGRLGN